MLYSEQLNLPRTDPKRWHLRTTDLGATKWEYVDESSTEQQSSFVKHLLKTAPLDLPNLDKSQDPVTKALHSGASFFSLLQDDSGIFPGQYKGPSFLTIGYVAAHYYTKRPIPEPYRVELIRFLVNNAHPVDGGWGLHTEDKSTCFGTTMNYVCLRLLGMEPDHPVCVRARATLHKLGGARVNPHWGKIWLSVLNLYKWEGVNPAPPELWLLPYAVPIHPARWWVHTRAIYLPVGYIQANQLICKDDELLQAIRSEIYPEKQPYDSIDFSKCRNAVCGVDLYYPHTRILDAANAVLSVYEKLRPSWLLKMTNRRVIDLIRKEQQNTADLSIAPVSFAMNLIVLHHDGGDGSELFEAAFARANEVVFHGSQGMTVMGTNGSQTWDAAFMVQYYMMAGLADLPEYHDVVERAYMFLVRSQFDSSCVEGLFRDERNGSWGFSTKEQGYTVSDCTAEAIKAIIMVRKHPKYASVRDAISDKRLCDGIDVLLSLQNVGSFEYGSFATYERIKASAALEYLNPAEVFNNIMVEYPYVECLDLSMLGLTYFHAHYPEYRAAEIAKAIDIGMQYIIDAQNDDGSWYGSWGVCYTYAGMFALEALSTVGLTYLNSSAVNLGCEFLISKQLPDGGWSESMKSSETHTYVDAAKSQVVQTAWAVIGLLLADYPKKEPIRRGIEFIVSKQKASGEWGYDGIEGVFNHLCAIEYPCYRFLFPIKALGLYKKRFGG